MHVNVSSFLVYGPMQVSNILSFSSVVYVQRQALPMWGLHLYCILFQTVLLPHFASIYYRVCHMEISGWIAIKRLARCQAHFTFSMDILFCPIKKSKLYLLLRMSFSETMLNMFQRSFVLVVCLCVLVIVHVFEPWVKIGGIRVIDHRHSPFFLRC